VLLLRGGRVIDPGTGFDGVADVLVDRRSVVEVGPDLPVPDEATVLDASGRSSVPGSSTCTATCTPSPDSACRR
jgi:dihydroorotase-like cyclic amidohydrolase